MGDARVGFALTGSFCTLEKAIRAMEETAREYPNMVPILSETTGATDTRFGRAADFRQAAEEICGHGAVESVREAEPIGPKQLLDVLVIAPCTGNTLAKLANGIADTSVTMAAKAHLRNGRPVVVAVSTNDGLGGRPETSGNSCAGSITILSPSARMTRWEAHFSGGGYDQGDRNGDRRPPGRTATAPAPGAGGPVKQSPAGIDLPGFAVGVLGKHSTVRRLPWGRGWGIMGPETPRRRKKKPWRIM